MGIEDQKLTAEADEEFKQDILFIASDLMICESYQMEIAVDDFICEDCANSMYQDVHPSLQRSENE